MADSSKPPREHQDMDICIIIIVVIVVVFIVLGLAIWQWTDPGKSGTGAQAPPPPPPPPPAHYAPPPGSHMTYIPAAGPQMKGQVVDARDYEAPPNAMTQMPPGPPAGLGDSPGSMPYQQHPAPQGYGPSSNMQPQPQSFLAQRPPTGPMPPMAPPPASGLYVPPSVPDGTPSCPTCGSKGMRDPGTGGHFCPHCGKNY